MTDKVAWQQAGLVRQLLAERENAVGYGQETRIQAIDKQLKDLGVKPPKKAERAEPEKSEPEGRATKQDKQHTA
jgi:hypothetical protein